MTRGSATSISMRSTGIGATSNTSACSKLGHDSATADAEGGSWRFRGSHRGPRRRISSLDRARSYLQRLDHRALLYAGCINSDPRRIRCRQVPAGSGSGAASTWPPACMSSGATSRTPTRPSSSNACAASGVDDKAIAARFHYVNPDEMPGQSMIDQLLDDTEPARHGPAGHRQRG